MAVQSRLFSDYFPKFNLVSAIFHIFALVKLLKANCVEKKAF